MLSNDPIRFKVGSQRLTAQSTMEAELVAAVLTMKVAILCSNMMLELGFKEEFGSVPLFNDNISALHVAANRTYSPRAEHIALRHFFLQGLVGESKITIYLKTQDQIDDLWTKHANKHRHRAFIKLIRDFGA